MWPLAPGVLGGLQQKGLELWPQVRVSPHSMLSGSWKPALTAGGKLGLLMQRWQWSGIVLDLEEEPNTKACRQKRCGSPRAANCPPCLRQD